MTDLETRLRDALAARATAVTYDTGAYDAILRRRAARRLPRFTVPIGAVATAAAMVGIGVVVVRAPEPAGPAAGGPAVVAAIVDGRAVVLDRGDLDGRPLAASPAEWGTAWAVAARGDATTFYGSANVRGQCPSVVFRMTAGGAVERLLDLPAPVWALAVSPDGRRLAYTQSKAGRETPCDGDIDLHVRDLATGKEQVWRGSLGSVGALRLNHLTWSPDGRYLAYDSIFSVSRIDTRAPGRGLPQPVLENFPNPYEPGRCWPQAPSYLPSGELVVLVGCENAGFDDPRTHRAVVLDAETGTLGRVVFRLPDETGPQWLSFDRTGRYALAGALRFEHRDLSSQGELAAYWWQAGERPRRVSGAPEFDERVVW